MISDPRVLGLNFISLYTHVQNDNVINTNEQVNDIQNGIQKEVLGLMLTVSQGSLPGGGARGQNLEHFQNEVFNPYLDNHLSESIQTWTRDTM